MFSYKHKTAYDMRSSDWSSCVCFTDLGLPLPDDAVVLASFGDASANHSTAQGAFNAAGWAAFQGSPMPLIFLCEDNGIGISTRTPSGWIAAQFERRAGLHSIRCDGSALVSAYAELGRASCGERGCQYV